MNREKIAVEHAKMSTIHNALKEAKKESTLANNALKNAKKLITYGDEKLYKALLAKFSSKEKVVQKLTEKLKSSTLKLKELKKKPKKVTKGGNLSNNHLFEIINGDEIAAIRELGQQSNVDKIRDKDGKTLLIVACQKRKIKVVEFLLKKKPDILIGDKRGKHVLFYAVEIVNNNEIVNQLVDYIKSGVYGDKHELKLLTKAFRSLPSNNNKGPILSDRPMEAMEAIDVAQKADKNKHDFYNNLNKPYENTGSTLLMVATYIGYINVVHMLVNSNSYIDIDMQNVSGKTALMTASSEDKVEIVKLLLSKNAMLNIQDSQGMTALMHASKRCNYDIVGLLLLRDEIDINIKDSGGWTAYDHVLCRDLRTSSRKQIILQAFLNKQRATTAIKNKKCFGLNCFASMLP